MSGARHDCGLHPVAALRRRRRTLRPALAGSVDAAAPSPARLLAPAALDGHRSHRLVLDVALRLHRDGREVALYADVPHATALGWPAWVRGPHPGPSSTPRLTGATS